MFRKIVLLFVMMLSGSRLLYCYDPVDTVWSVSERADDFLVSPDDRYLVILKNSSPATYPLLYDAESGTFITELDDWNSESYWGMNFSPNSRYLAVTGYGSKLVVWDMDDMSIEREFIYDSSATYTSNVCFSPTGDTIAFRSKNKLVLMDFETGNTLLTVAKTSNIEKMLFTSDGKKLIIQEVDDSYFFILDVESNLTVWNRVEFYDDWVKDLNVSPDGTKIITCDGKNLFLVNTENRTVNFHVDFNNSGQYIGICLFTFRDDFIIYWVASLSQDTTGIYIFNYLDSTILKKYNITAEEKIFISGDDLYLYLNSGDAINKIQLDWTVGVPQQNEPDYKFSIKPNPAGDYIEIDLERCPTSARCWTSDIIRIYNSIGECVMATSIHPMTGRHRMNIESLPPGIYFVRCGGQYAKFVKM